MTDELQEAWDYFVEVLSETLAERIAEKTKKPHLYIVPPPTPPKKNKHHRRWIFYLNDVYKIDDSGFIVYAAVLLYPDSSH